MEKKKIKLKGLSRDFEVKNYELFDWKVTSENDEFIIFTRDETKKSYSEIRSLEKSYFRYTIIPTWLLILLSALAFIFITSFAVVYITTKENFNKELFIPLLLAPGILSFTFLGGLSFIKTKLILDYTSNFGNKYDEYKAKVLAIKEKYNEN